MLDVILVLLYGGALIGAMLVLARWAHLHGRELRAYKRAHPKIPVAWQRDPSFAGDLAWIQMGQRCPELLGFAADRVLGKPVADYFRKLDQEELAKVALDAVERDAHTLPNPTESYRRPLTQHRGRMRDPAELPVARSSDAESSQSVAHAAPNSEILARCSTFGLRVVERPEQRRLADGQTCFTFHIVPSHFGRNDRATHFRGFRVFAIGQGNWLLGEARSYSAPGVYYSEPGWFTVSIAIDGAAVVGWRLESDPSQSELDAEPAEPLRAIPKSSRLSDLEAAYRSIPEDLRNAGSRHGMSMDEMVQRFRSGQLRGRLSWLDEEAARLPDRESGRDLRLDVRVESSLTRFGGLATPPDLDATRDYPDAYRENGRFGSHAGHDDYGNEAKP